MIPDAQDVLCLVLTALPVRHVDLLIDCPLPEHRPACWIYAGLCRAWTGASYPEISRALGVMHYPKTVRWAERYAAEVVSGASPLFVRWLYAVREEIGRLPWRQHPEAGGFCRDSSPLARFAPTPRKWRTGTCVVFGGR